MKHDNKEVKLEFHIPGYDKKDIKVNLTKDKAEIVAEKKNEVKKKSKGFYHEEKSYKSFYYSSNIPEINPKKGKVDYKKGVLKIKAPKKK